MQKQNVTEYKIIRSEIDAIKKCMTQYMGFLLLGAGAALSAWGGISALSKGPLTHPPIAYSSLALSLIAVSLLFILVYKFNSHNRYAGYCLLLSQEMWDDANDREDDLLIWELCVDLLRVSNAEAAKKIPLEYGEYVQTSQIDERNIPRSSLWLGLSFLFLALLSIP